MKSLTGESLMKQAMLDLISAMQAHRDKGGSPFDCPSMHAPIELKRELQRATNEIFMREMEKWGVK